MTLATHQDPRFGWGAAIAAYSLFSSPLDREAGKRIFEQLSRARGGAPEATRELAMPEELSELAEAVSSGRAQPETALRTALVRLNARSKNYFEGVVLEPSAIYPRMVFPDPLLDPETLDCIVVATYVKVPKEPWAQSIAFVLYAAERSEPQARRLRGTATALAGY